MLIGFGERLVVGTLVTVARVGHPSPKRRHLYETEEGERANPFRDLWAGAEAAAESCGDCGAAASLVSDSISSHQRRV